MAKRRNLELGLLIAAAIPIIVLYALYALNANQTITPTMLVVPFGLIAIFAAAHVAVRFLAPNSDPAILPVVLLLSGVGITFVTRLVPDEAIRQVIWLFLGVIAMIITLWFARDLEHLARYKYTIGIVGVALLILPMLVGTEIKGSKLWIVIGSFSFQPGEISKVFIVVFLASYLSENRAIFSASSRKVLGLQIPPFRLLLPLFLMWGMSMLVVIFERDLGSALLFFTIFLIMLYAATGRVSYVIVGLLLIGAGGVLAFYTMDHVHTRFLVWLDPFKYREDLGYQIVQGLYSMADGGLLGTGIGRGLPGMIPIVSSDFIFAAIAEELGLLGASAVLLGFLLFTIRGFMTAARGRSDMAAFTAIGLTASISFQAFVIVGGVTKLIPLTGVTLPFMSQGGSSLIASFMIVGLLLRCGDEGTGIETELRGNGVSAADETALGSRFARGAHQGFYAGLDTPESGALGRMALGRRLTKLVIVFALLFTCLIANLTYIQMIKADEYQNLSYNSHTIAHSAYQQRGSIVTSDGMILAKSEKQDDGTYKREYPQGTLSAHTVGYLSNRYGTSGIENTYNDTLTAQTNFNDWGDVVDMYTGTSKPGNSVILTIDSNIQQAAESALSGYVGAIVVLDPTTGAVLAKASSPTFDDGNIEELLDSGEASDQLFDRSTQALYAPGSTFKAVTLASALTNNVATLDSVYNGDSPQTIGNATVTNFQDESYGDLTLKEAFAVSANTAFGQVGTEVGAENLVKMANAFGYGTSLGRDFTTALSLMPNPAEMTTWETAWAAAGQPVGEHDSPAGPQTTVMQNAVIAATLANNGVAYDPFVVKSILDPDGVEITKTKAKTMGEVVDPAVAAQVKEAMLSVVETGTGKAAAISGVSVAGKTGTAETSNPDPDSWFIGFAPYDTPTVAIAVVIEQNSDHYAVNAAGNVLRAALTTQGVI